MKLGLSLVTCRPPLCKIGCKLLVRKSLWMSLLGSLLKDVGSVSSQEIFTTLKSKVAHSFVSDSISNGSCIAEPPRCDPKRGQRGGQCGSFSSSNGSSVAGAGRSAGLCPSGCSSRIMPTILSGTCSSPCRGCYALFCWKSGFFKGCWIEDSECLEEWCAWRSWCWSSGCSSMASSRCSSKRGWRVLPCVEQAGLQEA